jgi:hypothetical protein
MPVCYQKLTLLRVSRADVGVGVAVWARVLLPQVLGADLRPSGTSSSNPGCAAVPKLGSDAAARALRFLDLAFNAVRPPPEPVQLNRRGYPKWNPGTVALEPEDNALVRRCRPSVSLGF